MRIGAMSVNKIFVKEYLESLKEDKELDALFPLLLNLMGHRIIATPKDSKGMPQGGKDVVAIGIDDDGIKKKFYFELKGYADKDITSETFNKPDGIRDSINQAIDYEFRCETIQGFQELPTKIIVVHNGIIKRNVRPQYDGFIANRKKRYPEIEFDNWDIDYLTDLFSQYLFSEYLLTDQESLRLFKRVLVFLDLSEDYYNHFQDLVKLQCEKTKSSSSKRYLQKFFSTQLLIGYIIYHYSKENDNLEPAKQCITYLILQTWHWILENNLEKKKPILKAFNKLLIFHSEVVLGDYFSKTLQATQFQNGLYSSFGVTFEKIGYPLRVFEYLNYLVYFFKFKLESAEEDNSELISKYTQILKEIIDNNEDGLIPLYDNHSIAIVSVTNFLIENHELETAKDFISQVTLNLLKNKNLRGVLPEFTNSEKALTKFYATGIRDESYTDSSSFLILILLEYSVILDEPQLYQLIKDGFELGEIDLQTFYPYTEKFPDTEILLFDRELKDEGLCESSISVGDDFEAFRDKLKAKKEYSFDYKTDKAIGSLLRQLAHIYYLTPYFPDEWRRHITP
jgi:hypothetical protein